MAGDGDDVAAAAVDFELEAMRKDDCSWHPCQVYLSPNGAGLVIKYGNTGSKDVVVSGKEALMRLRVRSLPLQDDDCTHMKEGEHVVVNRDSQSESCFFDAVVEKVVRVRHSKRMRCRCTFMIKWLHQDLNSGSSTVPSSSIMRLANKSINNHPTISAFIDAMPLNKSSFSGMSPQLNVVNDIDLDLHDFLEKQIEEIRNSVHGSKKKIRDEILALEGEQEIQISTRTSHLRRSDWSQEAQQRAEVKYPTSPLVMSQSIEEELPDNRSPLNPLAARAALASLMSKLPQSLESSPNHEEREGTESPGIITHKQHAVQSLHLAHYSSSVIDDFSTTNKLFSEGEAAPKPVRITNSLFSTSSSSDMSQVLGISSVLVKQSGKGHHSTHVTKSREDKKMSPEKETRSTRAIPDESIERSSRIVRKKLSTPTNRRFTRSVLRKEGERQTIETTSVVEKDMPTRCEEYTSSDQKVMAEGSYASKDKETLVAMPLPVAGSESVSTARRKILSKMEERNEVTDGEGNTCALGTKNLSNMRRLTRSLAKKEAANIKMETIKGPAGDEFPRNEGSELLVGTNSIPDVHTLKTTEAISLPFCIDNNLSPVEGRKKRGMSGVAKINEETDSKLTNANTDSLPTEQRKKKRNTSCVATTTQDLEGNVTSNGGRSYGSKKNSLGLKKPELRSSPRFLRSQTKA